MRFSIRSRITWTVVGVLAASAIAVVAATRESDALHRIPSDVTQTRPTAARSIRAVEHDKYVTLALPVRPQLSGAAGSDPFAEIEPRKRVRPARRTSTAPPPPAAFPYRFAGRMVLEDRSVQIYLARGEEVMAVRPGDNLEGGFRVTKVERDRLEVVHVPTRRKFSMSLAALANESKQGASSAGKKGRSIATQAARR